MSSAPDREDRSGGGGGDGDLTGRIDALLDAAGARHNRDQLSSMLQTVLRMVADDSDRLDLKIANAALKEMVEGFEVFAPYRDVRKVTMFGSARIAATDPLYALARDLAAVLAANRWSTVTGAGPGIMAAGLEGAGPDHAFGINIRLPFEQGANPFIASDPKLVSMKYFFTRKLLLIKESDAYVVLPGGFGTLDEAFELLTLLQTGKAQPAPVILLDLPDGSYWKGWERFVTDEVASRNLVSVEDARFYRIVDRVSDGAREILNFYRNYHSARWVGDRLVIRLHRRPTTAEAAALSEEFADVMSGSVQVLDGPLGAERRTADVPDLARIAVRFDRMSYARLRMLIDRLNRLASAPPAPVVRPA